MAATGDRRFDELYAQRYRAVLAYCMRRGPRDDALDAANEVFAIAWRRIDDVPTGEDAIPWLFVVARRVLYRRRRSANRFSRLVDKVGSIRPIEQPDPAAVVVQLAEYEAVLEAASRLSDRDREVLRLAAWDGLSYREIAGILGCSIAAVDKRLHRAKQRLTKHFDAINARDQWRSAAGGGL